MKLNFDVTRQEYTIIKSILITHLLPDCTVWVFGSRAKHQAHCCSDLDLAISCGNKLNAATLLDLKEALDDSPIRYAIDIVDIQAISDDFRQSIMPDFVDFGLYRCVRLS